MKKIKWLFAGIIALALFVGFSAFTNSQQPKTDTEYYFYLVDENGDIDTGSPLNPGDPQSLAEFENPEGCDMSGDIDCVRAWEVGHTPTTSGEGDVTFKKDD